MKVTTSPPCIRNAHSGLMLGLQHLEIQLASHLLANNFAGVPESTISKMKQT